MFSVHEIIRSSPEECKNGSLDLSANSTPPILLKSFLEEHEDKIKMNRNNLILYVRADTEVGPAEVLEISNVLYLQKLYDWRGKVAEWSESQQ